MLAQIPEGNQLLEMQTCRSVGWRRLRLAVLSRGRRFVEATDGGGAAQKLLRRRRWS
jgi:hypothetical protein